MGNSWVWPRETSACQRRYRKGVVGASEYGATHNMLDLHGRGEGGDTSEAYVPMSAVKRELLCAACANANGDESSSDFCTMKRAAGVGLLMLAYEGAVAEATKVCNYCQSSSPVVQ